MNENSLRVSIILPTHNGSKYLGRAIDSCLIQTYNNIELILVDDGSTDGSSEIIRSYKDPKIRYIRHEKNKGLPQALNTGFSAASGGYLTWTSDDNEYVPTAIEEMVSCLRTNPDVDFVYTDYWTYQINRGEKRLRRLPDTLILKYKNEVGPCFLYTRRVYQAIGEYNPDLALVEDYDYWIRISHQFKALHYPKPLYLFKQHPQSLTATKFDAITLFDSLLKYQYGYISIEELGTSAFNFVIRTLRSKRSAHERSNALVQTARRIRHLSFRLAIMALLSLAWVFTVKASKKLYYRIGEQFMLKLFFFTLEHLEWYTDSKEVLSRLTIPNKKRNILFIAPYAHVGGGPRVLTDIARVAGSPEFSFHIITTEPENHVWDRFRLYFDNVVLAAKRVPNQGICNKYVFELIERLKADLVLITDSKNGYRSLPLLKSKFRHIKVIDLLHSEKSRAANDEYSWTTPYIDRRVLISNYLKAFMVDRYRSYGYGDEYIGRLEVVHNGVDLREYNPSSERRGIFKGKLGIPDHIKLISFVGRFSKEKNPLLFVDIARNMIMRGSDQKLKFVMAGNGPEFWRVKETVARYGIQDAVILPGMVSQVPDLLADTHLLVIVSKIEGIPYVIEEALAMNVPVVTVDVGAVHEVIKNDVNGVIIDRCEDVVGRFTDTILDLLSRQEQYEKLVSKTRETLIPEFLTETMGQKYRRIFDELLA